MLSCDQVFQWLCSPVLVDNNKSLCHKDRQDEKACKKKRGYMWCMLGSVRLKRNERDWLIAHLFPTAPLNDGYYQRSFESGVIRNYIKVFIYRQYYYAINFCGK